MTRLLLRASACLTVLLLLAGCSGFTPSEAPLPTVTDLRAEFDVPEPGRGVIQEGDGTSGDRFETTAVYFTSNASATSRLFIDLVSDEPSEALSIFIEGRDRPNLREGAELTASFGYSGTSDGSRGTGVLGITAVEGDRIAGVFAADLSPNGLVPDFPRIRGAFHATLTDTPQGEPR